MEKARILLVGKNQAQAAIIHNCLARNGYEVVQADTGMAAIRMAETGNVDIVLLDLMLPDIDGKELCRRLRQSQDTKTLPIIILTAEGGVGDSVAGLEAGADDYLQKPFDESELNARISARLRVKSQQDELRQKNIQLEAMLSQAETLATLDPLTGLFNRRRFEIILSHEFMKSKRYLDPLSCMMIDIDHFKHINDTFGHQSGDRMLRLVAQCIRACIREVDTLARWGGEEFVILSPNTSKENALYVASRILESVSLHRFPEAGGRVMTVSIGIAGLPDPRIKTMENLIHAADVALYEAKRKGRSRVETVEHKS